MTQRAAGPIPNTHRHAVGQPALTWVLLACILAISGAAIATAMRSTSTTFDEIVFMAAGARGFATGDFDLAPDHPPLMQYIYGLPLALSGAALPSETGIARDVIASPGYRYHYSARFFAEDINDPERAAFLGRMPAVVMALGLILVTFLFTRRHWGDPAALLAAGLVAFLPDVLGHGGVAYSDLPVTLALFGAAWAIDETVRSPSLRRGSLAGALTGLALGVKISAAALAPLAVALIIAELIARRQAQRPDTGSWGRRVALAATVAVAAAFVTLILVYRGDLLLEQFRFGLSYRFMHMTGGHVANAFLLGNTSSTGWWYFFPVAFLFKTPAGLHLLLVLSIGCLAVRLRSAASRIPASGLRLVVLGVLIFGSVLLTSSLNIGFRYAMPLLPWLCVLAAVGASMLWRTGHPYFRIIIAGAVAAAIAFPLSYYPHFLAFISEYGPERDRNHTVLVDSSLDWGQGLIELRDFMRDHDIPSVYLSYFGSARPEGYGIEYVPLASFFPLPLRTPPAVPPEWAVISATNLQGVYLPSDPFAQFRSAEPAAVLGHTLLVYHLPSLERDAR